MPPASPAIRISSSGGSVTNGATARARSTLKLPGTVAPGYDRELVPFQFAVHNSRWGDNEQVNLPALLPRHKVCEYASGNPTALKVLPQAAEGVFLRGLVDLVA